MSSPENPEVVSGEEALAFLRSRLDAHNYADHTDQENIAFTFEVLSWICTLEPRLVVYTNFEDINPDEIPAPIKLLTGHSFNGETWYSRQGLVIVEAKPETENIEATLPDFDELQAEGLNFPQIIEYYETHPEVYDGIEFTKIHVFNRYKLFYEPSMYSGDWGVEFDISESDIKLFGYGGRGKTEKIGDFVQANHGRIRLLSQTIVELAWLAAKYHDNMKRRQIPMSSLDMLHEKLAGNVVRASWFYVVDEGQLGIKALILRNLVEKGLLEPPDTSPNFESP